MKLHEHDEMKILSTPVLQSIEVLYGLCIWNMYEYDETLKQNVTLSNLMNSLTYSHRTNQVNRITHSELKSTLDVK